MTEANAATSSSGGLSLPPLFYYVVAASLLGIASFFSVLIYLQESRTPPSGQAAAAASVDAFEGIGIGARAAIVIDVQTGEVLYEHNADAQLALASLTKVPLVLSVVEALGPEYVITLPRDISDVGLRGKLSAGERWSIRDIATFTLVASSNQGAKILAEAANRAIQDRYPGASREAGDKATIWRMNEIAREHGMQSTYFLNVSGLDESTTQSGAYGSARDVAKLFTYVTRDHMDIFGGTARDGLLLTDERGSTTTAGNTNEALGSIPGLMFGKTGYTDIAGGNLAVVFDVSIGRPVVVVVLGSSYDGRFDDMKKLVAAARAAIAQ